MNRALGFAEKLSPSLDSLANCLLKSRWQNKANPTTGNLRQIIRSLEYDLFKEPNHPEFDHKQRLVHQLYIELNLPKEAFASYCRHGFLLSSPNSLAIAAFANQMDHLGGGLQKPEDYALRALGRDPVNTWALLALLESYQHRGKYKEAMKLLDVFQSDFKDYFESCPLRNVLLGRRNLLNLEFGTYDVNEALSRKEETDWVSWVNADRFALDWRLCLLNKHRWLNVKQITAGNRTDSDDDKDVRRPRFRMTGFDGVFAGLGMLANGESYASIMTSIQFLKDEDFAQADPPPVAPPLPIGMTEPILGATSNQVVFQAQEVGKPILHALALIAKRNQDDNERMQLEAGGQGLILRQGDSTNGFPVKQDEFAQQDAFVALYNCRNKFHLLGGLNSHRQVLEETLLVLALRAARMNRTKYGKIAQTLSLERILLHPFSVQSWIWRADVLFATRDYSGGNRAQNRARDLEMSYYL